MDHGMHGLWDAWKMEWMHDGMDGLWDGWMHDGMDGLGDAGIMRCMCDGMDG